MSVQIRSTTTIADDRELAHELLEYLADRYDEFTTNDLESVHVAVEEPFTAYYVDERSDDEHSILRFGSYVDDSTTKLIDMIDEEYGPYISKTLVQRLEIDVTGDIEVEWIEKTPGGDDS